MYRQLLLVAGLLFVANSLPLITAQEAELPVQNPQPRAAKQPTRATTPPLRPRPPLDRSPRLTDGATGEDGQPLTKTEGTTQTQSARSADLRQRDPDRVMATYIALTNREEIVLADIARERASSKEVRELAKLMSDDHAAILLRLKEFAPSATDEDYFNTSAKDARDNETVTQAQAAIAEGIEPATTLPDNSPAAPAGRRPVETRPAQSPMRDFNIVQVERELAVQCLASNRKMLDERRGAEFDHIFLAQQIAQHNALRDKLIVYQRYVSTPLAEIFADAELITVRHMDRAMELIKTLPASSTEATTNRVTPRTAPRIAEDTE